MRVSHKNSESIRRQDKLPDKPPDKPIVSLSHTRTRTQIPLQLGCAVGLLREGRPGLLQRLLAVGRVTA